MENNNKLNEYQNKFNNIKNENSIESLVQTNAIIGELTFEIVKALQIILQQNIKNEKKINSLNKKISELIGEPILIGDTNDTNNGIND